MTDLNALFDEYERALLLSPAIAGFTIIKRRVLEREGFIRVRAELSSGGFLEFSEYWQEPTEDEIVRYEYTYHWQDAGGLLIQRWDNARHHPDLPHAPHHTHLAGGITEGQAEPPTLQLLLEAIENAV